MFLGQLLSKTFWNHRYWTSIPIDAQRYSIKFGTMQIPSANYLCKDQILINYAYLKIKQSKQIFVLCFTGFGAKASLIMEAICTFLTIASHSYMEYSWFNLRKSCYNHKSAVPVSQLLMKTMFWRAEFGEERKVRGWIYILENIRLINLRGV